MKRLIINSFIICFLTFLASGLIAQSKSEMKSLVETMNKDIIELVKAGRYEALGKYYDMDAISLPNYRQMEVGYKLILNNNLGRKNGGYKIVDGRRTTTELIIGEEIMVDIGTYSLTADFPGLKEPRVDQGKYLNVWKKDKEGQWRIVAETWNADKSPNAPAGRPTMSPIDARDKSGANPDAKPVMDTKDGKK